MTQSALSKIENLLRLSRSSNPHEADLALQAAHRLARKNKIDIQTIDPDGEKQPEFTKLGKAGKVSTAQKYIFMILVKYFSVRILCDKKYTIFIGISEDCKVAALLLEWLTREYNSRWRSWKRKVESVGDSACRRSFYGGLTAGLTDKLQKSEEEVQEQNPEGYALVVVKQDEALDKFVKSVAPNSRKQKLKKLRRRTDFEKGFEEGQTMTLPDFTERPKNVEITQ